MINSYKKIEPRGGRNSTGLFFKSMSELSWKRLRYMIIASLLITHMLDLECLVYFSSIVK